mmetsp:Transcript_83821/g.211018  ORF Transcript_83821/g.211018 Transcript_83821/m.211018 type:complete len:212 (-) Transcript_83821:17-652(-)
MRTRTPSVAAVSSMSAALPSRGFSAPSRQFQAGAASAVYLQRPTAPTKVAPRRSCATPKATGSKPSRRRVPRVSEPLSAADETKVAAAEPPPGKASGRAEPSACAVVGTRTLKPMSTAVVTLTLTATGFGVGARCNTSVATERARTSESSRTEDRCLARLEDRRPSTAAAEPELETARSCRPRAAPPSCGCMARSTRGAAAAAAGQLRLFA